MGRKVGWKGGGGTREGVKEEGSRERSMAHTSRRPTT